MKARAIRLALVSALFVGWLGYLGYLVATRPQTQAGWPLVVSRPQVLTSEIDVIAEIDDPRDKVTVKEVLWPEDAPIKEGDQIAVARLGECRPLPRRAGESPPLDVSGPGLYLVPLRRSPEHKGGYEVAPVPPSPGFNANLVRVYPATPEALAQYRRVEKPE